MTHKRKRWATFNYLVSQLADVVWQRGIEAGGRTRGPGRPGGGIGRVARAAADSREHGGEVQRGEIGRRRAGEGAENQGELWREEEEMNATQGSI